MASTPIPCPLPQASNNMTYRKSQCTHDLHSFQLFKNYALFFNLDRSPSLPVTQKQGLICRLRDSFLMKITGDGTTPSASGTVTLSQVDTWLPHNLLHLDHRSKK